MSYGRSAWRIYWLVLICSVVVASGRLAAQQSAAPADLIVHNAKVLTVDQNFTVAQAVAVRGNQIAAVGSNQEILALRGPNTKVLDVHGRTVIPGLIDTHIHIFDVAEVAYGGTIGFEKMMDYPIDWSAVNSNEDVLNQIRGHFQKYHFRPGEWIYLASKGTGMTAEGEHLMIDGLTRWDLDTVSPDNPMVMGMNWPNVNGILVNSKAIDAIWPENEAYIRKYGRYWINDTGQPDGHFESPANRLFLQALPKPRPEDVGPVYELYAQELNALGITGISTRLPDYAVTAVQYVVDRGEWTVRFGYGLESYFGTTTDLSKGLNSIGAKMGTGNDMFWVISAGPTALDGSGSRACSGQTRVAAVSDVEKWWPNGQCLMDSEYRGAKGARIQGNYFREWLETSARDGVRMANTHAAADRTVKQALAVIEEMQQRLGPQAGRNWALDHCRMVDPADLPRAAKLGVMFSCATALGAPDSGEAGSYGDKIANTFPSPVKSMLKAGINVSVENSGEGEWNSIETLITRKDRSGKVWGPQERLTRQEALILATRNAANYILKEDELGTIETGKLADFAVLDKDYMTIPEDDIDTIVPQMTVLDGKIIWSHPDFASEYNISPGPGTLVATFKELQARRKPSGISRR